MGCAHHSFTIQYFMLINKSKFAHHNSCVIDNNFRENKRPPPLASSSSLLLLVAIIRMFHRVKWYIFITLRWKNGNIALWQNMNNAFWISMKWKEKKIEPNEIFYVNLAYFFHCNIEWFWLEFVRESNNNDVFTIYYIYWLLLFWKNTKPSNYTLSLTWTHKMHESVYILLRWIFCVYYILFSALILSFSRSNRFSPAKKKIFFFEIQQTTIQKN